MPVSSSTEHWIRPDALKINLNHFGDPDYLQVSLLAGAVVMAFKQDVISYNAAHNYRTWPLQAANTYLETSSAYHVYARLTRSEVNASALVVYDPVLRDIEGRSITIKETEQEKVQSRTISDEETDEEESPDMPEGSTPSDPSNPNKPEQGDTEILGEPDPNYFYVYLGKISASVDEYGYTNLRTWEAEFRAGSLNTNQFQNEEGLGEWSKMFKWNKVTDLIEVLKTFSSAIFKKLSIKKGDEEKVITDIKRSTDSDDEFLLGDKGEKILDEEGNPIKNPGYVPVSDETIPTTAWVRKNAGEGIFLRKDQDDRSVGNIASDKSIEVGTFIPGMIGGYGAKMYMNENEKSVLEVDKIQAREEIVANKSVSSTEFVSGFTSGKGWAVRMKEFLNSAGVTENRSVAEFDDLIVRGTMRVFEFIVSQMLGENDNRTFTGMMEVDHYDEKTGKVWLDTQDGKLYNTFRKDDIILVQQYNGMPSEDNNFYVTKQYELIIDEVGIGDLSLGENRLDWVTFRNFASPMEGATKDIITKGDTFVRIDNLTDPNRKGIMQIMTVGEDTPYMDVIYGAKTDPDNKLKSRFGNLQGVYNPLFGWLKDFGAYIANLYAVGEFRIAHTGEDVADKIEMVKSAFRTSFRQSYFDMIDETNYLKNGSFAGELEGWTLGESGVEFITLGGSAIYANRNIMTANQKFAGRATYNDKDMLRIYNSNVRQANEDVRKFGTHKEYVEMDGSEEELSYEFVEVKDKSYLFMRFYCSEGGTLEVGFNNADTSEHSLPFVSVEVKKSSEEQIIVAEGVWNGEGDFVIECTGDVYIEFVTLTDKPLENLKTSTETWIRQDAGRIALLGRKINSVEGSVTDLGIELDATNEELRLYTIKTDGLETKYSQLRIDVDGIDLTVTEIEGDTEEAKRIAQAAEDAADQAALDALEAYFLADDAYDLADVAYGKATSNASTISIHSNYISILNGRFNEDGSLVNASGLVTTSEFNSLYSAHYDLEGEVATKAEVSTSVQYNPSTGLITSAVKITADEVDINNGVVLIDANSAQIGCYTVEANRLTNTNGNYTFILDEIGCSIEHTSASMPLFLLEAHATYGSRIQMYDISQNRWVYINPGNFTMGNFIGASFAIDLDTSLVNLNNGLVIKNFGVNIGSYITDGFYVSSTSSLNMGSYSASSYKGRVLFVYFTSECSVSGLAAGTVKCKYGTIFISNGSSWYHFRCSY